MFALVRGPELFRTGPAFFAALKKPVLLAASYAFYAAWDARFVALLAGSTLLDFYVAKSLHRAEDAARRRAWLGVSIALNLGVLGVFKYGGFFVANVAALTTQGTGALTETLAALTLPVGISFYTFQTLSYTLDVYRRELEPSSSLLDYALYVSFFPQLVAGPIVRARDFLPQLKRPRATLAEVAQHVSWGLGLFVLGLFNKVVVADALLAPYADRVFDAKGPLLKSDAALGALAFSGQIWGDFSGYSLCAIGIALTLGFKLPDNFRSPYAACGFSDFWRRWHISLSTWLRDYLYIPLGGNRHGVPRALLALMITMLLGGLWHGAAWNFIVWGALHGALLVIEHLLRPTLAKLAPSARNKLRPLGVGLTFALVTLLWIYFRAPSLARAHYITTSLLFDSTHAQALLASSEQATVLLTLVGILVFHALFRTRSLADVVQRAPPWTIALVLGALLWALFISPGTHHAFLYFQF